MIVCRCPGCEKSLQVKEDLAGKKGKCLKCGHVLTFPQSGPKPSGTSVGLAAQEFSPAAEALPASV